MTSTRLFTSESVSDGHPDKVADQISDGILDAALTQDPHSRVAIEAAVKSDVVMVFGEMTTNANIDISEVVRTTLTQIGYDDPRWLFDPWKVKQVHNITEQSNEIGEAVTKNLGAGDQGIMFGYAVQETPQMMPLPMQMANEIMIEHKTVREEQRKYEHDPEWQLLGPDAKSQVTIRYSETGEPIEIDTIVLSSLHGRSDHNLCPQDLLREIIMTVVRRYSHLYTRNTKIMINTAGPWSIGGPVADAGLTGRKIIVDTYGGAARHGGGAFCVDGETEFLTPIGWKRIDEYQDGDLVGQYEDGALSFVLPEDYIDEPAEEMYNLTMPNAIDQVLSPGHRFVYMTTKGNLSIKPFREIMEKHENADRGSHARVITTFYHEGGEGIDLLDDEIRLMVAAIADGTYPRHGKNTCRFRLKKERKITRLRSIIERLGLYSVDRTLDDGFTYITVDVPRIDHEFGKFYWDCSRTQMEIIAEEVVHWDGDPEKHTYRTTDRASADYIQYVWTAVYGKRASILQDDRVGEFTRDGYERKTICYQVSRLKHSLVGLRSKTHKASIDPVDRDRQYCFTVPSGMLILRRNDKIFVTGNSGKDPTKVDRSAAYAARRLAKTLCAKLNRHRTEVQLSYAIGVPEPVSIHVYGMNEGEISEVIADSNISLSLPNIITQLDLLKPKYQKTAAFGHFGRDDPSFTWETVV